MRLQRASAETPIQREGRWIDSTPWSRHARINSVLRGHCPATQTSSRSFHAMGRKLTKPSNRSSRWQTTMARFSPASTRRMPMIPVTGPRTAAGQPKIPAQNRVCVGKPGGANRWSPVPTIPANMNTTATPHNTRTRPRTLTRCHSTISDAWCFVMVSDQSCRLSACGAT